MRRARAMLVGVLAASTLTMSASTVVAPSSASASGFIIWGQEYCLRVPVGTGGYTAGCALASAGGNFARAIVDPTFLLHLCLFVGVGFGMFADSGCVFLGVGYGFRVFSDPPALSIKVKGGASKLETEVLGTKAAVACTSMEAKEPEVESGGSKTAGRTLEAALVYSGCTVEKPVKCEANSAGKSGGTIETKAVESRLVENSAKTKVENLFQPQSGTTFAEIEVKGAECLLKGAKFTLAGNILAEGGKEDEISRVDKNEAEGKLGTEEDGEAVEKPKLLFEASSKKYINDETGEELEAKLKVGSSAATLTGEATSQALFSGSKFKSVEPAEEVTISEGVADLGIDRQ